ncbi:hypothetical protein CFAM422_002370 [Trichoderma lentiforme]|uniref:Uncharacterized protein n=1 Tax=Trichoderma lentiforme TaxID=1567552 RepID=A0A9P5CI08_9HYPO|nr:hypothetical protein CFAM422_002370 [Trichoderma lentiforme]
MSCGSSEYNADASAVRTALATLAAPNPTLGSYGVVEFYITCNPPLLPLGVKRIIESAQSACQDKLLEILYEPEIPWFKCITVTEYQSRVSDIIQHLLHKLLKKEVRPLDFNVADTDVREGTFHPDVVSRETNEPVIIPWVVLKSLGSDIYQDFEEYRFPAILGQLPFKTVWRGLQNSTGVSIDTLLSVFSRVSKSENAPNNVVDFAFHTNCEMSHNLRENLIYIGSWQSMDLVDRAVRRLQTILNLLASKPKVSSHLILLERPAATKLTYRWMSHVGLVPATFAVRSGGLAIAEEYKYLSNAAVIRTHSRDRTGRWITDNTVYPLKDTRQLEVGQTFNAFKGYILPTKKKNAKVQVLHDWKYPKDQASPAPAETRASNTFRGPVQNSQIVLGNSMVDDNLEPTSPVSIKKSYRVAQNQELHNDKRLLDYQQPSPSAQLSPKLQDADTFVRSTQRLAITESEYSHMLEPSTTGAVSSLEELESTAQRPFAASDCDQEDLLIFLSDSDEEVPCEDEMLGSAVRSTITDLQKVNEDLIRFERFERSDDLIWLDDESQAQQSPSKPDSLDIVYEGSPYTSLQSCEPSELETETETEISTIVTESNPLEVQEHTPVPFYTGGMTQFGLMDAREHNSASVPTIAQEHVQMGISTSDLVELTDTKAHDVGDLVDFGLIEEKPREFFQTMNQRGGRSIINSSQRTRSPRRTSLSAQPGPAPRNQNARSTSMTPKEPRVDAEFDSNFPALGAAPKSPMQTKQTKPQLRYADAARYPNAPSQKPPRLDNANASASRPRSTPSMESVASSSKVGESSKEPKLEDSSNNDWDVPQGKGDVLRDAENQLKKMSQILELTSGYVSLEVVFGRIYIKQMAPSFVNHTGSGRVFATKDVTDLLNGENFRQDRIGFSPILSTSEGDANMLVSITPPGETPWNLFEKETWYDFQCTYFGPRGEESIIIELNAQKLQYRVRGPRHEIFAIHLHCPQRAWDMKARGVRSRALEPEYALKCYVESLIDEMDILADDKGDVTIQYPDYNGTRELEAITMRRVARYCHGKKKDHSALTVTMSYSMEESLSSGRRGAGAVRVFACPKTSLNSALPQKYFEASLTSSRLRHHFNQNVNLEYGDKTTWNTDQLEAESVFEDMLRPAFGMISHMDHIGSSNDTMRGVTDQDAFHESLVEVDVKKKNKKWAFW